MGCASSSPLINGGGPGGVVESAKEATTKTANDVLHAGEAAIHDVGEHMKEAVQNVTHEIENVLGGGGKKSDKSDHINENDGQQPMANGHDAGEGGGGGDPSDYQIIRLKGSKQNSVEETELMENMKNDLLKAKAQGDDADRLADDLMKETEELMRDAETGIAHHEMTTRITATEDGTIEILNLEEPEIERILADGEHDPDSPKATLHSLAVPGAPEDTVRAGKDEGMPPQGGPQTADKPDVVKNGRLASLDDDDGSMGSSGGEEHFLSEVLKATSIRTPGRSVERRPPNIAPRAPPPSTSRSDRMQRFIFKLNSIILSDIEERTGSCEDGSIVRQLERNPERVVELLSKSSLDNADEAADGDVSVTDGAIPSQPSPRERKSPANYAVLRRQHSVVLEGDSNELTESGNGDDGLEDERDTIVQLQNIPPAVRLRALMRFKSLDGFGRDSTAERKAKVCRRMSMSFGSIDAEEEAADEGPEQNEPEGEEANVPDDFQDVPYDPEQEERICEELLAELRALEEADQADAKTNREDEPDDEETIPELPTVEGEGTPQAGSGPKTAWEKLQDYLQRVPKNRSSNYDLFYDSDEDTLRGLFKRHKLKLMFHYSDSSSGSSDTL